MHLHQAVQSRRRIDEQSIKEKQRITLHISSRNCEINQAKDFQFIIKYHH